MILYNRLFFWTLIALVCIGFVINFSGSIPIGIRLLNDPYYFIKREIFYYIVTFFISMIVLRIPVIFWRDYSFIILFFNFFLLSMTLIIDNSINGASRWIVWGVFCIQPSEFSKLSFVCYLANYLSSKSKKLLSTFWGICKPILIIMFLSILLLMQPDFGSTIVLFITTLFILFIFGIKFWKLIFIIMLNVLLVMLSIVFKPYRIQRILSFWNPWKDPFGYGYQLTQSLIAFGQGRYFGQGLGNSIQKLEYLPEAHTDFIFSIFSEEMGCFGAIILLCMLCIIIFCAMHIGYNALNVHQRFSGILACSIGVWFSCQIFINIGMVEGILPTKGLTLPFISYGGSSFLITVMASILLLRIDFETRLVKQQAFLTVYSK